MQKVIFISLLLIATIANAADQKVLDFCHEYIGEAIKQKEPRRMNELVFPIYRGTASFGNLSSSSTIPLGEAIRMPIGGSYGVYK